MQLLHDAFQDGPCLLDVAATDIEQILRTTLDEAVRSGRLPAEHLEDVLTALVDREKQMSTAIGHGVAVPHAYLDALESPVVAFVRLSHAVNMGAPDGVPTRFLFVLLGPTGQAVEHLDTLTHIARLVSDDEFRYEAAVAETQIGLLSAFERFSARTAAPAELAETRPADELTFSGRLFGGFIQDIRRRRTHYVSDFTDGLHSKCISSTLYLFFACLAPAVTFGGFMAISTGNQMGAVEMIAASAFCGIVYALIGGQPLIILGGTGPLMIFTVLFYDLCGSFSEPLPFLPTLAWVGLWSSLFLFIMAATDSCCLMRYFTRFTDEIFAAMISIIFIFKAVESLWEVFTHNETDHAEAFLAFLLAIGTFYIAANLSRFRRSRYLMAPAREFMADFGPAIAIMLMTAVAIWMKDDVPLDVLPAPDVFQPTDETRSWLVDLTATPMWARFAAIGPAILVAVLVYVDQNITARLVNSPDHKLQKGTAYHLDMVVMGVLVAICSMFGLPWLVAATVRSLNHVRSLATIEEVVTSGGDKREKIIHVRETRLTGLLIHLLIGLSLLLLPLLKVIPMAVLYGLFLFMGVVSMSGNQLFERLNLWLMDSALYPVTHYIRKVPIWTIHKFTILQVVCLGILAFVEVSPLGILFPIFIVLLVPIRILAGRFFEPEHLAALDAEEEPEDEATHWSG